MYGKFYQSYKTKLLKLITKIRLEGKVFLNDTVPIEKIIEILNYIDIGVVPDRETNYIHQSLSTKAFEYAVCGIPIVASRLKSIGSVFRPESVLFFETDNPDDFAKKTIELCNNPD